MGWEASVSGQPLEQGGQVQVQMQDQRDPSS